MFWPDLQDALREKHRPIAKHFNSGIGLKLQRVDADIAELVMLRMMQKDIPVLPIHESFISWIGQRDNIINEMKLAYRERMKADIPVEVDSSVFDSFLDELPDEARGFFFEADLIEQETSRPGYEGYRQRLKMFMDSRSERWHQTFGDRRPPS